MLSCFIDGVVEAHRGQVTCPRPPSWWRCEQTHGLRSFLSPGLSVGDVVWICAPAVERETGWPGQHPRPEYKAHLLADSPRRLLFAARRVCLVGSSVVSRPLSPLCSARARQLLLLLLPSDQQLFYVLASVLHCTFVVRVPTFRVQLTFMLLKGRCVCGPLLCSWTAPMKWNLKPPVSRGTHINHHFSLSLSLGPLWLLYI